MSDDGKNLMQLPPTLWLNSLVSAQVEDTSSAAVITRAKFGLG